MTGTQPRLGPVVVIGAGLIGASIGQALSRAGERVHLVDHNPSHRMLAASRGAGVLDPPEAPGVRLVVVAVPPRAIAGVVDEALDTYRSATVTDVGSVKEPQLRALVEHRSLARYVGSHPMAGSHLAGPLAASAELFAGRTWVVTPHAESDAEGVARATLLAEICGARAITMTPAEHDLAVGRVSHLPHLLAAAMASQLLDADPDQLALSGQGVRDVTRVAGSDPALWEQIISANARVLVPELRAVAGRLGALADELSGPEPEVAPLLAAGVAGVGKLPGKHGEPPASYGAVVVRIPDELGALARLFSDVDRAGVNVEDIRIEHDPVLRVGDLRLLVVQSAAADLAASMAAAGWSVRPDG